jgi:hypothetical protein
MPEKDTIEYYVLFRNYHESLRLHDLLKKAGIKCAVSPTPREANSSCGISIIVPEECLEQVYRIVEENGVTIDRIASIHRTIRHRPRRNR